MAAMKSEDEEIIEEATFLAMIEEATTQCTPLSLHNKRVTVSKAVKLKRSDALIIQGGTIIGESHSIFAIGTCRNHGPPALTLDHVKLVHTKQSDDRREIGAAVFIMGKAHVLIIDSTIYSIAGFGLW